MEQYLCCIIQIRKWHLVARPRPLKKKKKENKINPTCVTFLDPKLYTFYSQMSQNDYSILQFRFSYLLRKYGSWSSKIWILGPTPMPKFSGVKNCFCYVLFYYSNAQDLYQKSPWLYGFNSVPLMVFHLNCSMHMNPVSYFCE